MSNDLGITTHPTTPAAVRLRRTGWRDPRLWIGVLLVTASVVVGARLLAAADDTTAVWVAADDLGAGALVDAADLEVRRVRFADSADLAHYLPADQPAPAGTVLTRGVGAGELLPAAALADRSEVDLLHIPLEVDPHHVPPAVRAGSVIDIYLAESMRGRDGQGHSGPALEAVTVVEAPPASESFAITGARQLVVAVPEQQAVAFQDLYGGLDNPSVRVLQRS
jgi:hypothetical protein